jgi:hypothetical protein
MSDFEPEAVTEAEVSQVNTIAGAIVQLLIARFPDVGLRMACLHGIVVNVILKLDLDEDVKLKIADRLAAHSRNMLAAVADVVPDGSVH